MSPERTLSILLERTRDVVLELDREDRIRAWNPAAERVLGWTASEAIGRAAIPLLVDGAARLRRTHEVLATLRRGGVVENDIRVRAKDGTDRLLLIDVVVDVGPPYSMLVIGTDVSERERVADKLAEAARLEQLPLIARGVSHDLNNLLAVVSAATELAARHSVRGVSPQSALSEACSAVQRAAELNHRLAGIATGEAPMRAPTSIASVVRDTASFSLVGRATALECRIEDTLWPIEADPGQISQVVQNLVTNAAEAMDGAGRVIVEAENVEEAPDVPARFLAGAHIVLRVRDHGAGIAPEHRSRVFDPFFTTKPRGSGLGLATSSSIVRAHQGFVQLRSTLGEGSTFEVWLPALPGADQVAKCSDDQRLRSSGSDPIGTP